MDTVRIIQVLLLFDEQSATDYGSPLWTSLHEVEAFYNLHGRRINAQRFYISPDVVMGPYLAPTQAKTALDLLRQDERLQTSVAHNERIKLNTKTYDQKRLFELTRDKVLRELFGTPASEIPLMIITDRPITPPENWRYIICDTWPPPNPGAVISTVPLDPAYWQTNDQRRVATIKERTRAAIISICGQFLGLQRCHNRRCFLYSSVESVNDLDLMVTVGPEHSSEIKGLIGHGFERTAADPGIVQQVVLLPSDASVALR
jgi:predicted Zn-dependent protease